MRNVLELQCLNNDLDEVDMNSGMKKKPFVL